MDLSHHRAGSGEPLVLVHGIGSRWQVWAPVLAALEAERDVLAVDLPGFGRSPVLDGDDATPAAHARAVAGFLDALGIERAHVAGNSLGGWVGLELSKLGRTLSVCTLSPAGFWSGWELRYARAALQTSRRTSRALGRRLDGLLASPARRRAFFAQVAAHGDRLTAEEAVAAARDLAGAPGWDATLDAMTPLAFTGADEVRGPVTIAWAEKDRLLPPRQHERARALLPRARHLTLFGCGHVPTWDSPDQVTRAILTSA
jgi:pimeloyl-ACP methyl ester carboxylesterase